MARTVGVPGRGRASVVIGETGTRTVGYGGAVYGESSGGTSVTRIVSMPISFEVSRRANRLFPEAHQGSIIAARSESIAWLESVLANRVGTAGWLGSSVSIGGLPGSWGSDRQIFLSAPVSWAGDVLSRSTDPIAFDQNIERSSSAPLSWLGDRSRGLNAPIAWDRDVELAISVNPLAFGTEIHARQIVQMSWASVTVAISSQSDLPLFWDAGVAARSHNVLSWTASILATQVVPIFIDGLAITGANYYLRMISDVRTARMLRDVRTNKMLRDL